MNIHTTFLQALKDGTFTASSKTIQHKRFYEKNHPLFHPSDDSNGAIFPGPTPHLPEWRGH